MSVLGRWRITEMDLWDQGAIDLLGPVFIESGKKRPGHFSIHRWTVPTRGTAGRTRSLPGIAMTRATWPWAKIRIGGSLNGRIFTHQGENLGFKSDPDQSDRDTTFLSIRAAS